MICSQCHYENPREARFCIECGSPLEVSCPRCGGKAPAVSKFCMECGHKFKASADSALIHFSRTRTGISKIPADKIHATRSTVSGECKSVTVLFADVANYTSIAERLDPEEVHEIMDGCFKILMGEIHRREGSVNQFTGDGVMALFGAPLPAADHAGLACRAALSIQKFMTEYGKKIKTQYGPEFSLRIGLNSGPVMVGVIGDDLRVDYAAVGSTTNLAAQMESMAEPGTILATENTFKMAQDFFRFEPRGEAVVQGNRQRQKLYRLIG